MPGLRRAETILERREADDGFVRLGHGVVPAYFSQQEMELDTRGSVLQCVQRATGLQRPDAQKLLGRFLFSGWTEHEKPVVAVVCEEFTVHAHNVARHVGHSDMSVLVLPQRQTALVAKQSAR